MKEYHTWPETIFFFRVLQWSKIKVMVCQKGKTPLWSWPGLKMFDTKQDGEHWTWMNMRHFVHVCFCRSTGGYRTPFLSYNDFKHVEIHLPLELIQGGYLWQWSQHIDPSVLFNTGGAKPTKGPGKGKTQLDFEGRWLFLVATFPALGMHSRGTCRHCSIVLGSFIQWEFGFICQLHSVIC